MNGRKGNNAGFSLVELIVVIAIMAVLMGVLAPTLINNISKSRESTDLQNIDTLRDVVSYAMADEAIVKAHAGSDQYCTLEYNSSTGQHTIKGATAGGTGFKDLLQEYIQLNLADTIKLSSPAAKDSDNFIQIEVDENLGVVVRVATGTEGATATTVRCNHTKDSQGNLMEFISK